MCPGCGSSPQWRPAYLPSWARDRPCPLPPTCSGREPPPPRGGSSCRVRVRSVSRCGRSPRCWPCTPAPARAGSRSCHRRCCTWSAVRITETYSDFLPVELLPSVPGRLGLVVVIEPLVAGHHLLVSSGRAGYPAQQRVDVERVAAVGPALARDNTSQDYC